MTDSTPVTSRPGKRDRLVASAADLLHRNGVSATTIADIAHAADVPVGNVYYYFKTKDDLVRAVIRTQADQVGAMLGLVSALPSPAGRLKALVSQWDQMRDVVARYGCPFGTLVSELDRRDDGIDVEAAEPIQRILDWTETQFRHLTPRHARENAIALVAGVQGGALLANSMRDPSLMTGQVRHLERWIDTLAATPN
ncbi:TetR/AcrR family transcriptional regulator [Actinocrispum wychmicini]|uniref:TetR family transcriptional regulator n=1 Tax=Actinocrispum wychmicini TaxID=1213861 RepID=A0A4R2IIF7_9PSEU|nr:TetR/AcrR family transcriptional regulator [Actinocrispum wychmicini]TCO44811.1 TetR family transcriptional regulator [Actinocrispum wychmicini]